MKFYSEVYKDVVIVCVSKIAIIKQSQRLENV